jgi:hypothetical protein
VRSTRSQQDVIGARQKQNAWWVILSRAGYRGRHSAQLRVWHCTPWTIIGTGIVFAGRSRKRSDWFRWN